jgi:hypothetical protein
MQGHILLVEGFWGRAITYCKIYLAEFSRIGILLYGTWFGGQKRVQIAISHPFSD